MKTNRNHPLASAPAAFRDEVDRLDPLICPRADLDRLMKAAPSAEARAWLVGINDTRKMLANITGGAW